MNRTKASPRCSHAVDRIVVWLVPVLLWLPVGSAFGQATNQITDVTPNTGAQGTASLLVTFTLDTDVPPAPPAGVMPDSVTLGTMTGTSVTHSTQYEVTAVFNIPAGEPTGAKDAAINFTTPNGSLVFSLAGGFTVTAGADIPPSIIQHPQSQTVLPGGSVTFTVIASGTEPMTYQWQDDIGDIPGATLTSYTIDPVAEADAGNYRCVVTNAFGTATSNDAVLTVAIPSAGAYPIVDTGQDLCYGLQSPMTCPSPGSPYYGQDAQYFGNQPSYTVSGDGLTVYDNVTGLTWTPSPDLNGDGVIDVNDKLTFAEALTYADTVLNPQHFGGFNDWRLPTMKQLYSLMDFRGTDPDPTATDPSQLTPFIDTNYFDFAYGDLAAGERIIDAQFWSSNEYVGLVFVDQAATFGLNLADGRIKGYPSGTSGPVIKVNYVYFVRGNTSYGVNDFVDNGDGTITDMATGLMWTQDDQGDGATTGPRSGMLWGDALAWVEQKNTENYLGHNDWRMPNAKELHSLFDYSRAPDATGTAAIDPIFNTTQITNEDGQVDFPWFWTGTTHGRFDGSGTDASYMCFGRSMGYMNSTWMDVHGAGAQRSDDKSGDFTGYTYTPDGYYFAVAPQGDAVRMYNYVRLVRDAGLGVPYEGYNLFTSLNSTTAYLMDNAGIIVHTWNTGYPPGQAMYFLENGELLHTGNVNNTTFNAGGAGGIIQMFDWDGNANWEYLYSTTGHLQHHDVEMLPGGNVLLIAWEYKSQAEAVAAGRDPSLLTDGALWPDSVIEVAPTGPTTGNIVWEWHVWDHLVQDYDATKANYGVVADHPELVDLNYIMNPGADWNHVNAVDYNADLDQIVLSVHNFGEIWVIDHGTTSAEAAGHSGGSGGMGGDLLYRWGNPQTYGAGTAVDQQLFGQHDAEWIETGLPGAGHILIFNNGMGRTGGNYSSIDEITPPVNPDGSYTLVPGSAFEPAGPTWTYTASVPTDFFAQNISGQQRLPNGNTLICDGPAAHFFEVTADGTTVWEYTYSGQVFRIERYAAAYPGFDGTPLDDQIGCSIDADCDDGIGCTDDTCQATVCVFTPNDANCPDDGLYCNGVESCDATLDCVSSGDRCVGQVCDEVNDVCTNPIPTVSTWGMIVMVLLLLMAGSWLYSHPARGGARR